MSLLYILVLYVVFFGETGSDGVHKGRTGDDRDIAAAVLYLAGPGGVFLNGQILYPDGGAVLPNASSM